MLFVGEAATRILGHGHVDARLDRRIDAAPGAVDLGGEERREGPRRRGRRRLRDGGGGRQRGGGEQQGKRAGHGRPSTTLTVTCPRSGGRRVGEERLSV